MSLMSSTAKVWSVHSSNFLASIIICLPVAIIVLVFSDLTILNQLYYYLIAVKSMSLGMTTSDFNNGKI